MKKVLASLLFLSVIGGLVWAGCKEGNISVTFVINGEPTPEYCCKAVGDGSAFSCTADNQDWILVGE